MSNIHGLHTLRNKSSSSSNRRNLNDNDSDNENETSNDDNNRYVGGVNARGGGSGLAVLPNPTDASDRIFNMAESAPATSASSSREIRRTITMYRSGFTVDNGPYRRLSDASNSEFLTSLARGVVPRELGTEGQEGVMVGLVDRRMEEYDPERHASFGSQDDDEDVSVGARGGFQSFSGEGQSLGSTSLPVASQLSTHSNQNPNSGVIDPSHFDSTFTPPALDPNQPSTSIAIRLLDGKRLVVKINLSHRVSTLAQHIGNATGGDSYVLTSGYPPRIIQDLEMSIQEAGLMGAQIVLKKVG